MRPRARAASCIPSGAHQRCTTTCEPVVSHIGAPEAWPLQARPPGAARKSSNSSAERAALPRNSISAVRQEPFTIAKNSWSSWDGALVILLDHDWLLWIASLPVRTGIILTLGGTGC